MNELRHLVINIITAVMAFLSPIKDFMMALILLFGMNFICGVLADILAGKDWSFRKAFTFIKHCFLLFGLAAFIYACGNYMHNQSGAIQCVSYISYLAIWIYSINIVRNMKLMCMEGTSMYKLLDIIYYIISVKIITKIPYLQEYVEQKKGGGNGDNN